MSIASKLDRLHLKARENRWLQYFAIFIRIALAIGFIPAGMQKILGERFTVLAVNHPMGHYLEALFYTGYYYTFIGIMQVTAGVLLLIPRTVTLGAIIYFPIILNICILSLAVRFDGSLLSSPLMVLANMYLLCWDYHKLKFIFPFNHSAANSVLPRKKDLSNKFPIKFFSGVAAVFFAVVVILMNVYELKPHNHLSDCEVQCNESENPQACIDFCNCIHLEGQPLEKCLEEYNKAVQDNSSREN